jgi:hypothetical protein
VADLIYIRLRLPTGKSDEPEIKGGSMSQGRIKGAIK